MGRFLAVLLGDTDSGVSPSVVLTVLSFVLVLGGVIGAYATASMTPPTPPSIQTPCAAR